MQDDGVFLPLLAYSHIFDTMSMIERCALQQKYHTHKQIRKTEAIFWTIEEDRERSQKYLFSLFYIFYTKSLFYSIKKNIFWTCAWLIDHFIFYVYSLWNSYSALL